LEIWRSEYWLKPNGKKKRNEGKEKSSLRNKKFLRFSEQLGDTPSFSELYIKKKT